MAVDTHDPHNKVVSIFQKHRRGDAFHHELGDGGEMVTSPDGFEYVSFKYAGADASSHHELEALQIADSRHYVVKLIEHHKDHIRVDNYHVEGSRLAEFMDSLPRRPGKLLEIKQFLPDNPA
ncbi:MAG: hypothetical protein AB7P76_07200 [Candidatus Melainabacteria bacterium]